MNSSRSPSKRPSNPLPAAGVMATGLAEALDIVCDPDVPEATRLRALQESWEHIDRFRALNYIVELTDAQGGVVSLDRDTLPAQAIASITFRSAHVVTYQMLTAALAQEDPTHLNTLLSRHTSLGAGTLVLPVKAPQSEEWAELPIASDAAPEDLRAHQTVPEQPPLHEAERPPLRLILGGGQSRKRFTAAQLDAFEQFLESVDRMKEILVQLQATLPTLLEVPEAVEMLEQHLPGLKDALTRH